MGIRKSPATGAAPPLLVRTQGSDRRLRPGPAYLIGRDPLCDIVISDAHVSWQHAVLRVEDGRWVLSDNGSTNGIYSGDRRVDRIEIDGECLVRLSDPVGGPGLSCTAGDSAPPGRPLLDPGPPLIQPGPAAPAREAGAVWALPARTLRIGRAPDNDIVVPHLSVSSHHAELSQVAGGDHIADLDSHNGTFVNEQRVTAAALSEGDIVGLGDATFRFAGHELRELVQPAAHAGQVPRPAAAHASQAPRPAAASPGDGNGGAHDDGGARDDGPLEIPYAVRWLVPRGERFANFDLLNDNDTQLDYYRRFGHIYAVGIPAKKWRLVVVSDPELLDKVAADEEQFGKRVEEINFFDQLRNSRGGGISVISDGEHYERIRRVMLPWYSPAHQRTQLERMKEQARKLVAAWSAIPDDEPLDARAWMERYTLEVSGRSACAYDFGLLHGHGITGDPHPFAAAVPASTKESILRVAEPRPDFTAFAGRARRARRKAYRRHNEELFRTADALVHARMHTCPLGQQTDLLSRLVSTPDPETGELLDAETVRDQILMHLSNGFNGPSITAAWLAYVLATHPDVEEKLIAEIDGITGGDPDYDLRYDDLMALTYTTQVIKETMRIYPPMPVTIRRSLKDGRLGRYRIRNGDIILVGTLAAQRDPRYWGLEPDRFDPEQFAAEKVAGRPRHAFIPFSIGKRQCMAQEVTFMMLRVVLFEIYRHYRLRVAPGATVIKNTVVTTKPAAVPVTRLPRERDGRPQAGVAPAGVALRDRPAAPAPAPDWGEPTEIPGASAYRHLVIAYGSNFGANKELAERFAERGDFHGYTSDVLTLNELAESPPRTQPWLLVVMTSTYTSNPPSNATAFKSWLERTEAGGQTWRNCRYLVWGLGNSQWNAFLAFPRYVHGKLSELGATPAAEFAYGDVGSPGWERRHADWNARVWPVLLGLSGARPTTTAAERVAARNAATGVLTGTDSDTAMQMSLAPDDMATQPMSAPPIDQDRIRSRVLLAPAILTNPVGMRTVEARVLACRELQAAGSPKRTRHLEISLPSGVACRAGDHLGVCPKNDEDRVERLARHLGATLDGLFMAPKTMTVRAVPKGVVLQVRNVLTNLIDITGRPTVPLLDLLLEKAADPAERTRLGQIRDVLQAPDGPGSPLRAAIDAGGYDVLRLLDEFPSCSLNIFEFLQVALPLRPRYYSVSSSPRICRGDMAHLTVGLEAAPVPGRPGREHCGMSSHYMHALREGDRLTISLDSANGFRLQEDVTKPMIFVSAGTGLAPMRAFLWERLAMKRAGVSLAEAALFNGIRSSRLDYIYRDEIGRFATEGVLNHVHVATSRERPGHRDYVQDRIREQGALVWRLLAAEGYVYVCGSRPMRDAVRDAFIDVVAEHGPLPRERAEAYLQQLESTARYRPDLWG
jgi:cytochrome P450 / NADPH-cytochrome P450 reductase